MTRAAPASRQPAPGPGDPDTAARQAVVVTVLCTAVFMGGLDLFIVNIALNKIGHGLGQASLSDLSWVINGYAIFYAALLVPAGRLADRFGRKAALVLGLGVFTAASLGCALSTSLWLLVAFRCLQAAGAAVFTPASLGLILTALSTGRARAGVRWWASSSSFGAAAGPVAGGFLLHFSWRWIFVLNVPIGLAAAVAAIVFVPGTRHQADARLPDLAGGAVLIASIGALALGLVKVPDWGWSGTTTVTCFLIAAACLAAFLLSSARHPAPILELSLLRNWVFAWSNVSAVLMQLTFAAELLSVALYLQDTWHWSPFATGLGLIPAPLALIVIALAGNRLTGRLPVGVVLGAGILLQGLGAVLWLAASPATRSYAADILPGWIVIGTGAGLALPSVVAVATADLPPHQTSTGAAVVNMGRQVGSVLGTSILVLIIGNTVTAPDPHSAFMRAWWTLAALSLAGGIAALAITGQHHRPTPPATGGIRTGGGPHPHHRRSRHQ